MIVGEAAKDFGVDERLLASVIANESGFNPRAVSKAGAQGLGQMMPDTGKGLGVTDPFDPRQNIAATAAYLSRLVKQFGSVPLAIAAYNAGPGAVEQYKGVPPYSETQNYVKAVLSMYEGH